MSRKHMRWFTRCLAVILGVIIVLGLIAPALAAPGDTIEETGGAQSGWTAVSSLEGSYSEITRNSARDSVTSGVHGAVLKINEALTAKNPREKEVMTNYVTALIYADWAANNAGSTGGSGNVSIYQGADIVNSDIYVDVFDDLEAARQAIAGFNTDGLLPTQDNSSTGEVASNQVVDTPFASGSSLVSGSLLGYTGFYDALAVVLQEYVDSNVTGILEKYYGGNVEEHFTTEWCNAAINDGKFFDEMLVDIRACESSLAKYIDIMNTIVTTFTEMDGTVLQDGETEGEGDNEHTWSSFKNVRNILIENSNLSQWTIAIHRVLKGTTSEDTRPDTSSQEKFNEVDLSEGTLKALSNATTSRGNVVFDTNEDPNLTSLGYYVLGAGVVYDPFVSYSGDSTYLTVLQRFMDSTSSRDDLLQALQVAVNTKKPLYVTDASKNKWSEMDSISEVPVADYRTAFLADVLETNGKITSVFCVALGEMQPSQVDSSTLDYVRGGHGTSSDSVAAKDGIEQEADGATGTIQGVEYGSDQSDVYRTAGTAELVASESQMSKPVMITSLPNKTKVKSLVSRIGAATSLIIRNAAQDCKDNRHIKSADTEMLFLNGLGDIVLSDGTIVLPAISNPVLYDYSGGSSELEDGRISGAPESDGSNTNPDDVTVDEVLDELQGDGVESSSDDLVVAAPTSRGFYPYTAALINHYPISRIVKETVHVTNPDDVGKFVFSYQGGLMETTEVCKAGKDNKLDVRDVTTSNSVGVASNTFAIADDQNDKLNLMPFYQMEQGLARRAVSLFGVNYAYTRWIQTFANGYNEKGQWYFPLQPPEQDVIADYVDRAGPLVTSAVRYVTSRDSADVLTPSGTFRTESYIADFLGQGLMGTQYAETLVKNNQLSYDELVADQYGRFTRFVKDIVSSVLETLGHIDGVLSLKDGYSNGFFNVLVGFIQDFYLIIAVVLLILVAVRFLKGNYGIVYVLMIGVFVFAAFEVYAVWMPTAVPSAYNMVVNDIVEDTVWSTVSVSAERYNDTYRNTNRRDAMTGNDRAYTATITLYKMTFSEMEKVAEQVGVDYKSVKKGDIIWLDMTGGIFIQGDQIKMSVDSLLANNTMRGLYRSQWEALADGTSEENLGNVETDIVDNPYEIRLTEPYTSLEAYYTPFNLIERSFIDSLNRFTRVFTVQRNSYNYGQNLYKDAFMFTSFTNSGVFLAPGEDDILAENIKSDLSLSGSKFTPAEVVEKCHALFDPQEDWLNLRAIFGRPSAAMKQSLWGAMLQRQGYYNADWSISDKGMDKLATLIAYINNQTKQFIIRNQDQLQFMSDENAIKMVALYATTAFTHHVSEFGYWLYPNYVNSSDIELTDVLYGAMTTLRDREAAIDGDIVNTVVLNLGLVGAILILLITVLAVAFIFIMTYLVPILYALFGLVLVYKLLNSEQGISLVKGYVKVTAVTIGLYILFSLGLKTVKMGGYNWYGYVLCLLIILLCLYFLVFVVMSVLSNPMELGNDVLARNMFSALDKLTGNRLSRLTGNRVTVNSRSFYGNNYASYSPFMRRSSIDNRVNRGWSKRGQHYGRWEDFDDDSLSQRARVVGRFGKLGEYRQQVGTSWTGFRTTAPMRMFRRVVGESDSGRDRQEQKS